MVVSAFGREKDCFSTDNLSKNIESLSEKDKDQIMTFGEVYSSLIIKNELLRENVKVASVSYDEIGIICDNNYQNGNIVGIDMHYLEELIDYNDIVIVPGFIAQSMEDKIISLGRNTSDLTAIIIGDYFKLDKVNIIKDVKGVYKKDPKKFIILATSFILAICLLTGTSYAALSYISKTHNISKIEAGTLALELKNEENSIILLIMYIGIFVSFYFRFTKTKIKF